MRKKPDYKLTWQEHIRKRPGMYLGQINHKGFADRLKVIITQICEMSNSDLLKIIFKNQNSGILIFNNIRNNIQEDLAIINLNRNPIKMDLPVLNALSSKFSLSFIGKELITQEFRFGNTDSKIGEQEIQCREIVIEYDLDEIIWGNDFSWNSNYLSYELREFCYLNPKIKFEITHNNEQESITNIYHFKNGLIDRLEIEILNAIGPCYFKQSINYKTKNFDLQIAFAIRQYNVDHNFIRTYVNNELTPENGTHLDGFLKGLIYGATKYIKVFNLVEKYKISKKRIKEGLVCMINIRMEDAIYSGSVKNRLASSEILEPIAEHVAERFYKSLSSNNEITQKYIDKFEKRKV
ncbi:MAG: hypothetical protein KDC52_00130 [Ignavibacteriae bacterium]|nr:hypothetical protein [Ignavibacteriota bacterium]